MTQRITKHMAVGDVAMQYPETLEVFSRFGLHCVGCHVAAFETIEQGAMAHGIDADELVNELNKAVSKPEGKTVSKIEGKAASKKTKK